MKLCEIYGSIQGEGPNTGEPTTFIRFGGCNLRCPGWGFGELPDGTIVPGCDTVFAVYPEWRDTWDSVTANDIADRVGRFPQRICLTGGEPLIQPSKQMAHLVQLLRADGHTFDLFTNGSQKLPMWARIHYTTVVMDYKLPGSGEYGSFNEENWELLQPKDAIKFVIKDDKDFEVAMDVISSVPGYPLSQVYFGVVWGTSHEWLANKLSSVPHDGIRMNLQTHKFIWDEDKRGV